MNLTIEAVYENGVLRPTQPLPLKDHQRVDITIQPKTNWIEETAGIIGWQGTHEELRYFALDPDLDPEESS